MSALPPPLSDQEELQRIVREHQAIINSRVWRAWTGFRHSSMGRALAAVYRAIRRTRPVAAQPQDSPPAPAVAPAKPPEPSPTVLQLKRDLEALGSLPPDTWVAIHHPDWPGIRASSRIFDHLLPLREVPTEEADSVAAALLDSGVRRFVFSSFWPGWREVAVSLRQRTPQARLLCLWHGSTVQMAPGSASEQIFRLVELCRQGVLDKLGFVKQGLAETFAQGGLKTAFVMNYMRYSAGERRTPIPDGRTHIGVFLATLALHRNIYTQLCAASFVPNALVHLLPSDPSLERLAQELRVQIAGISTQRIPQPELLDRMAAMHCNLKVTLSECCPMTVLESLSLGVPCLLSAVSHLFRDNEYLHSRLCVQFHDNPQEIAKSIARALEEREEIIRAYDAYIPGYNARARQSVERFLEE